MITGLDAADGTRLDLRVVGSGDPVVLVHGSAGDLNSWTAVVEQLRDEFELWTYTRRGYGTAELPARPVTFADDADDLLAVVAAAGSGRPVHVVGGSHGAVVALHAAASAPAALRSLVVFEPSLYAAGPQLAPVLDEYRALVAARRLARASRLFAAEVARVPAAILDTLPETDPDPVTNDAIRTAVGCGHDLAAMVAGDPDPARWAGLAVPTTVLAGELTWSPMPETTTALAAALDTERIVLPGQSHFATHTAPDLFAGAIRGVLSRRIGRP